MIKRLRGKHVRGEQVGHRAVRQSVAMLEY
jgi:hypothetical protein